MQQIKSLSDEELLNSTERLAIEERRITVEVLWHLREVDRRRLFAARGFPSLWEYCIRVLQYSEGAASRSISAMRLLKDVPGAKSALCEGTLNLSHMSAAQNLFRRVRKQSGKIYTLGEKQGLLSALEGTSRRECDRILASVSPGPTVAERERVLANEQTEIRFVASPHLMEKFNRLKDLAAHRQPDPSWAGLFDLLADLALKKLDPSEKKVTAKPAPPPAEVELLEKTSATRAVSVLVKRQVWHRDRGQCTWKDIKTGRVCGTRYKLELDHIRPFAKGGASSADNLRLLCRQHNLWHAMETYGQKKMAGFVAEIA